MTDVIANAQTATRALRDIFPATPLQRSAHLSAKFEADIWLKREDLTPVRSYKIRGAVNAMHKARLANPEQNLFVCASAGNHAQGMAFACQHYGVRGVVFMPVTTPDQKINQTRAHGGDAIEIRLVGDYFDEALASAREYCAAQGAHFLAPFDDADVMEGQASVAVEILEQLGRSPDLVVMPVGGGGLSSGVSRYLGTYDSNIQTRYVEPMGARSLHTSLEHGALVTLDHVDNFVDGASVARIGEHPFEVLRHVSASHVLGVPEDRLCITILEMLNVEGIVLEPAGALTIDALTDLADDIRSKTVICIASGGNFDFVRLPEVRERAQRYGGLKKYFLLRMPQRPGALRDFLEILGPDDDIARFEYLKKSARNFGTVLIGIETSRAENFDTLLKRMSKAGFSFSDVTNDETVAEFIL